MSDPFLVVDDDSPIRGGGMTLRVRPKALAPMESIDGDGRPRAILGAGGAGEGGAPGLQLVDRSGTTRAELTVSPDDAPQLVLEGKNGNVFKAPVD